MNRARAFGQAEHALGEAPILAGNAVAGPKTVFRERMENVDHLLAQPDGILLGGENDCLPSENSREQLFMVGSQETGDFGRAGKSFGVFVEIVMVWGADPAGVMPG